MLPRPKHDGAVGVEGLLERLRMIALQSIDDRCLVDRVVDLPGGPDSRRFVRLELVFADREDRIGVEAVEGAQCDELVVSCLHAPQPTLRPRDSWRGF